MLVCSCVTLFTLSTGRSPVQRLRSYHSVPDILCRNVYDRLSHLFVPIVTAGRLALPVSPTLLSSPNFALR